MDSGFGLWLNAILFLWGRWLTINANFKVNEAAVMFMTSPNIAVLVDEKLNCVCIGYRHDTGSAL